MSTIFFILLAIYIIVYILLFFRTLKSFPINSNSLNKLFDDLDIPIKERQAVKRMIIFSLGIAIIFIIYEFLF
ncbi:hypothetical protein [uncultured Tenacibaculum sp.]|uniref:hypothetical protein n=1 Tax=uncultured Tenacibaculum sp. TaxID=174713 RepID=UPI002617F249|nr:hypothetical protein [uncultured Tenacibaculum sp.]